MLANSALASTLSRMEFLPLCLAWLAQCNTLARPHWLFERKHSRATQPTCCQQQMTVGRPTLVRSCAQR